MFLNHDTAFDTFAPITTSASLGHSITTSAATMLETQSGWRPADALQVGDAVATLDGGFAEIRVVTPCIATPMIHVPGGTLSACSDVLLPATAHVALPLPDHVADTPLVSVPLAALCGWKGIARANTAKPALTTLCFQNEEMVYAQTGLLLHANHGTPSFFERKSYGETRALLTLLAGGLPAPDAAAAA